MPRPSRKPGVLVFGTYDRDYARISIIRNAMRELGWHVQECQGQFLPTTSKKLALVRGSGKLRALLRVGITYPKLLLKALAAAPFDFVMITTGGFIDIVAGWLVARMAGAKVIFDPLYGLYETVVEDRRLVPEGSILASAIKAFERFAFRLADTVLVDTEEHREYFVKLFRLPKRRIVVVPVGADDRAFVPLESRPKTESRHIRDILFYGSMIPLHGAEFIVQAAHLLENEPLHITLVGSGQLSVELEEAAKKLGCRNVTFLQHIPYESLAQRIGEADICLGIFGPTLKCYRVVPNKVYQCLAMGKPVITGDTPAIRRMFTAGEHLLTVPCGDAAALARAIRQLCSDALLREKIGKSGLEWFGRHFATRAIADRLKVLEKGRS